jgi:TolB-like protein
MNLRGIVCLAFLWSVTALAGETLVVLPFDDVSGGGEQQVMPLIVKSIEAKGWRVLGNEMVAPILEAERVRYLDSLDEQARNRILAATGASSIVTGTVYTWSDSRNPSVALSARLIGADGALEWAGVSAISSDDTERVLGFGRETTVSGVATHAVQTLLARFPRPGEASLVERGPAKPLFRGGPVSYHARELTSSRRRVCILPFDNLSATQEAPRIVADILSVRLAATPGFEVIEPGVVRAAALEAKIGSFRGIRSDDLRRLSSKLGTPLFLRGTIYSFIDPSGRNGGGDAEVQMEISLVDVDSGRVMWAAQHSRRGSDYIGFLMLGKVTSAVRLTDRVVTEMIDATGKGRINEPSISTRNDPRHRVADVRRERAEGGRK